MTADRSYVTKNREQLERLRALVDKLSDQELAKPMEAGWTVAAVLAHLAFWDYRIVTLLDQWNASGTPPSSIDERHVDWINDAGKPLCLALPPRVAARTAVEAALTEAQLEANAKAGNPISVLRAEHRHEHLDEIERKLKASAR